MKVVLFDGVCGLCTASVKLLIKLDKKGVLTYSPLQGEYAKTIDLAKNIDSIVFVTQEGVSYKSTAILKILRSLGGVWVLVNIFYLLPRFFRDFIYDNVANYRYVFFGKNGSCMLPNSQEIARFIP